MKRVLQRVRVCLEEAFAPEGMTTAQLQMLHHVAEAETAGERVSSARVARMCGVRPQTMQTLLVRAEEMGWLRRGTDAANERLVLWAVTARGRRVLQQAEPTFRAVVERAWAGVSAKEMREMERMTERMLRNLEGE